MDGHRYQELCRSTVPACDPLSVPTWLPNSLVRRPPQLSAAASAVRHVSTSPPRRLRWPGPREECKSSSTWMVTRRGAAMIGSLNSGRPRPGTSSQTPNRLAAGRCCLLDGRRLICISAIQTHPQPAARSGQATSRPRPATTTDEVAVDPSVAGDQTRAVRDKRELRQLRPLGFDGSLDRESGLNAIENAINMLAVWTASAASATSS